MSATANADVKATVFRIILTMSLVSCMIGLFLLALGSGIMPVAAKSLMAPRWIIILCGVPFILVGATYLLHAFARSDANGKLPPTAPLWMHVMQLANGLGVYACLGIIGTWVAFSGDNRGLSGPGGPGMARVMFGFGAGMIWIIAIVFATKGVRDILRLERSISQPK